MKLVNTGSKILLLIILLSPLVLNLESCKKTDTFRNTANALPTLTTTIISSITVTGAISGGNISSDGGSPILSRGIVWSTSSNPTVALSTKSSDGTGTGSFISNISGLGADTTYFVRAYATTSRDTAYGNEVSFSTEKLPILTTITANTITASSAITGGNISSDGGSPILSRGVVWSTSSNPTIALPTKTSDGTGTGNFISNLTGLSADTTYFVRAYATTSQGTAYGNEINFKSSNSSQVGIKLVGSSAIGNALQGNSVAISGDGNTLVFSGPADNNKAGAVWIYNRTNTGWNQVDKLVGFGALGYLQSQGGISNVAISGDGKTIIVGAPADNLGKGAAWIFILNNGIWAQQGSKLVGTGAVGNANQGSSVSISGDGNSVIIGGFSDNFSAGTAWIFTRNNGFWAQQGNKLVGTGAIGNANQGNSVSISSDGKTVVIGGDGDDGVIVGGGSRGAAWVFTRINGVWSQQGDKLVGTGIGSYSSQGFSVSISGDGNTILIGGPGYGGPGGAWIFTRNGGIWVQQGDELVGSGAVGYANQGSSVSISGDGNSLVIGGFDDNFIGASWIFTRNTGNWAQQGSKLVGTGNVGNSIQGSSVSINSDGKIVAVGGPGDNGKKGAVWIFDL